MRILFLDDDPKRHAHVDKTLGEQHTIVHAWTVDEALGAMQDGTAYDHIYLDHDLNDHIKQTGKFSIAAGMCGSTKLTGRDVSIWMARNLAGLDCKPKVTVHSWNGATSAAPAMVKDLQEAGFSAVWQLFNGGVPPEGPVEDNDRETGG
jgi:CheY-like chemotaxis protein